MISLVAYDSDEDGSDQSQQDAAPIASSAASEARAKTSDDSSSNTVEPSTLPGSHVFCIHGKSLLPPAAHGVFSSSAQTRIANLLGRADSFEQLQQQHSKTFSNPNALEKCCADFNLSPHASNCPASTYGLENFKTIAMARERAESGISDAAPLPAQHAIPPLGASDSEPLPKRVRRSKWD